MPDDYEDMVEALKKARVALQELTDEYRESIASHRRNGKILREIHGQKHEH